MVKIYISIGSNIDRERNVLSALKALREKFRQLIPSPVYETKAIGFEGEHFYNLVVGTSTDESAQAVVSFLRQVEDNHGRQRNNPRFSSRTLDLDLLTYGNEIINEGGLIIPRDEITRYAFVLRPLSDIAPNEQHPVNRKTYRRLWREFDKSEQLIWPVDMLLNVSDQYNKE